jgi:hypothetical protein
VLHIDLKHLTYFSHRVWKRKEEGGACLKVEVEGLKGSAWFGTFELKTLTDLSVTQLANTQQ